MIFTIRSVHYHLSQQSLEFIEEKLQKFDAFQTDIDKAELVVIKEGSGDYLIETHVHFRWGKTLHIEQRDRELYPCVEKNIHRLSENLHQEKERVKKH